jgi:5-methylcytosine-specific restriction endonuclease McrA
MAARDDDLRKAVRRRARFRCEYCQLPEAYSFIRPFHLEHIVARKHRGPTALHNTALACDRCNYRKGSDLTGIDPATKRLTRLYNPRRMKWSRHFRWNGPMLVGRTPVGRVTIAVLQMNHEERLEVRKALIEEGVFPR